MFTIYHTNDFHNQLSPTQARRLGRMRSAAGPNGLLLDAGDAVSAGNITFRRREPVLEEMRAAGYDAMTVGNREFHFSRVGFHAKIACAGFPVLCANVRAAGPDRADNPLSDGLQRLTPASAGGRNHDDPPVRPWLSFVLHSGRRIIIVGLTVPMITQYMAVRRLSSYVFDDPIEAADRLVPALRNEFQPDLLIALTHIGIARDRELARSVQGIDLIIGGHSHTILHQGERVGSTLIAQSGARGQHFGRIDVDFEAGKAGRPSMRAEVEVL